jgi:hypothetical protein
MPDRSAAPGRSRLCFAAACAAALWSAAAAFGQGEDVLPSSGMDSLNAEWKKHKDLANDFIRGLRVADPKDLSHVEALDARAKYDTYRFTWVTLQQKPGDIAGVYDGGVAIAVTHLLKAKPETNGAMQIYSNKMIEHGREVLASQRLVARVNAARALAKLAELGPPELADTLAAVLQDANQSDAVKYYAARGLKVLAEQQPPVMSPESEKKAAEALAAFVDRKMTIADTTTRDAVEGFRLVRREGIRALARFRNPGVADHGRAGLVLLRVVAKDDMVPPPRMDERVEAAIGVARFKPSLDKEYNPDYAAAQLGLFLEEFNREDTAERQRLAESKGQSKYPWKVMASRMYEAFEDMRAEVSDNPYALGLASECLKLLGNLEKGNFADPEGILRIIATTPPPSGRLFKNIEDSTVKPANRQEGRVDERFAPPALETKPQPDGAPAMDSKPGTPPASPAPAGKQPPPSSPFAPLEKKK